MLCIIFVPTLSSHSKLGAVCRFALAVRSSKALQGRLIGFHHRLISSRRQLMHHSKEGHLLRLPVVSWQIHAILLPRGKQLLLQLVYLTVQLLDVSCLRDALIDLRSATTATWLVCKIAEGHENDLQEGAISQTPPKKLLSRLKDREMESHENAARRPAVSNT